MGSGSQPWVSELGPGIPAQLRNADHTVNAHGRKLRQLCKTTATVLCTGGTPLLASPTQFRDPQERQPSRLNHVVDAHHFHHICSCGVGFVWAEADHLPLQVVLQLTAAAFPTTSPPASAFLPAWKWDSCLQGAYASLATSPWCGPRCTALRLQLRQAKLSLPQGKIAKGLHFAFFSAGTNLSCTAAALSITNHKWQSSHSSSGSTRRANSGSTRAFLMLCPPPQLQHPVAWNGFITILTAAPS